MGVSDIQSGDAQICSLSEGAQLIAIIICRLQTGGSTLQNVSQDTLKRLFVLIPDREIVRRFNTVISPILEKNYNNMKENYTLTRPRDYLLPLLMNGQVRVSQS